MPFRQKCFALPLLLAGILQGIAFSDSTLPATHPLRQQPRLLDAPTTPLPRPALIGTPKMPLLLGYMRRALHLPDGDRMAMFSFGSAGEGNWLFLVDGNTLVSERFAVPQNDIATHGAALGADGNIYVMPYNTARAYRFNVAEKTFESLTTDLPEGEYTWEAWGGSNGCIYFGTYPNAYFGEYNPATDQWRLWKQIAPNTKYVTRFSEAEPGVICFKAWGPDEVWMRFDCATATLSTGAPLKQQDKTTPSTAEYPLPKGEEYFTGAIEIAERRFAISVPSGKLWELMEKNTLRLIGDTGGYGNPSFWTKAMPEAVMGISYFGATFRYDLATDQLKVGQLDNLSAGGNAIMFLATVTPRCVIGANYSQQNLFRVDPVTGEIIESTAPVARTTGEPMCAIGFGGRGYVGIYTQSLISVFDPEQPFAYEQNPKEIARLGETYQQTRPRDTATDGKQVYITSDSAYNALGGALAIIDPATEEVAVIHHLIKDQNLPSLAYDPSTKLLWGGTDRWGQMRSCPPTAESALIYAFDPDRRKVVDTLIPWPDADVVHVHGISRTGILVASCKSAIALIHTPTRTLLYQGPSPIGIPAQMCLGADGKTYALASTLYEWNLEENTLSPLAQTGNCIYLTEASPGLWVLGDATSLYRLQLK